jgi:hypothetical protein
MLFRLNMNLKKISKIWYSAHKLKIKLVYNKERKKIDLLYFNRHYCIYLVYDYNIERNLNSIFICYVQEILRFLKNTKNI